MKKIATFLLVLCLTLCIGVALTSCGGDGGTSDSMMEIQPTTLDIGAEGPIEVVSGKEFEIEIRLGWENWQPSNNTVPDANVLWSESRSDYVEFQQVDTVVDQVDGWLVHYATYRIVLIQEGSTTLTVTTRGGACTDGIEVTVLEGENNGGGDDGGNSGEYLPCPEENLELELVGDHYVVKGIGTYVPGSVNEGTYANEAAAINIYNRPFGIPITEIANGAFSGLDITHFGSSTVTKIGDNAFEGCTSLQGVILEWATDKEVNIGAHAFAGCENLVRAEVYDAKVKSIGEYAFAGLTKFAGRGTGWLLIQFVENATIGAHAFEGCTSLVDLDQSGGEGLIVGDYAFAGCTGLVSVENFYVSEVGAHAFDGCENLGHSGNEAPGSLRKIGEYAFNNCRRLSEFHSRNEVEISDYAFSGCAMLISVSLDQGARKIGAHAFEGCASIEDVSAGASIGVIGEAAFKGCKKLYSFSVTGNVDEVKTEAFFEAGTEIEQYLVNKGYRYLAYHVTEGTRVFRYYAFRRAALSELDLSKTEIIEGNAFSACKGEVRTSLSSSFTVIPEQAFLRFEGLYNLTFNSDVTEIGDYAFSGCKLSDESFTIPSTVTKIGNYAFSDCSLRNGNLPASLTQIGENAFASTKNFYNCTVTLSGNITEIGKQAFWECAMTKIIATAPGTYFDKYEQISIGEGAFEYCTSLEEVSISAWSAYGKKFTSLQNNVFKDCSSLKVVDLGYVKYVGLNAFENCSALTSFSIKPRSDETTSGYEATAFTLKASFGVQYHASFSQTTLENPQKMAEFIRNGECDNCTWTATRG